MTAIQRCASGTLSLIFSAQRALRESSWSVLGAWSSAVSICGGLPAWDPKNRITVEHDTNNIHAMLKFYPHFDGKDKAHCWEYKGRLRVVLSQHRQSVAAILQRDPKPTAEHFYGGGNVGARERKPLQHPVVYHGAFCQQRGKRVHGQGPGGWGR